MRVDREHAHEKLERLTAQDLRILKLEAGPVSGHTCKVLVLEPPSEGPVPTVESLRAMIAARLDAAPRLRQRLAPTPLRAARPAWVDDDRFDIAAHVRAVSTDGPVDARGLQEIVGHLHEQRLERGRPLWRLDVVEGLEEGGVALVLRVHHAMADGAACVRLLDAVLWRAAPDPHVGPPAPWSPAPRAGAIKLLALGLGERTRELLRMPSPAHAVRALGELLSSRRVLRRELAHTAAVTPFARPASRGRKVAFAQASLGACRACAKAIDPAVTVNDVVLALVAGGLRAWLEGGHGPAEGIRVKVPVSLHRDADGEFVANRDSYFLVDLPLTEADPARRLLAINRESHERKVGHDAEALYHLGVNPLVARWSMSPRTFTFNVSNIRGPAHDMYVLAARVRDFYSLGEIAQNHALRIAVTSFAGTLSFGLLADLHAVEHLHVFADGIRTAVAELLELPVAGSG